MEKWNKICYYLSEKIKTNILEKEFEPIVEKGLEILGWNEYSDDFVIRPSIQLGSRKERITPDFVVKSNKSREKLFVIEIKRPKQPLNEQNQIQLSTYMRQYKLDFGLLIGPKIQLFYDGELNKSDNAILIEEIEFIKDNNKGLKFVQLFQKEGFNLEKLKDFASSKLIEIENKRIEKELKQKLLDSNQGKSLKILLKSSLLKNYNENVIDNVFKTLEVYVLDSSNSKVPIEQNNNKVIKKSSKKTKLSTKLGIKKREAINILNSYLVNKKSSEVKSNNVTFSNLIKPKYDIWWVDINPKNFEKLFYILFNDYKKNNLYFFEIPEKEFYPPDNYFYFRDDTKRYSIRISSDDTMNFKDIVKSNNPVHLKKYLKHKIEYKEVRNIPNQETQKAIYEAHNSKDLKPIEDLDKYFESL